MEKIIVDKEYFNIEDTLTCGQLFRFYPFKDGYFIISSDKACYAYQNDDKTIIECNDRDKDYFYNFFDLDSDYKKIVTSAKKENVEILTLASEKGKGIRILKQNSEEMLFSFIISQNNHIPRIKSIINNLCKELGEKREFYGETYYAFPSYKSLASKEKSFYSHLGLGYRDEYIVSVAKELEKGFSLTEIAKQDTENLKKSLIKLKGVGPKVADCVTLFGFNRFDSFPVDTWIEKLYRENFNGVEKDRNKISKYFVDRFKNNSGIYQQYLFHYKRNLENK